MAATIPAPMGHCRQKADMLVQDQEQDHEDGRKNRLGCERPLALHRRTVQKELER